MSNTIDAADVFFRYMSVLGLSLDRRKGESLNISVVSAMHPALTAEQNGQPGGTSIHDPEMVFAGAR